MSDLNPGGTLFKSRQVGYRLESHCLGCAWTVEAEDGETGQAKGLEIRQHVLATGHKVQTSRTRVRTLERRPR